MLAELVQLQVLFIGNLCVWLVCAVPCRAAISACSTLMAAHCTAVLRHDAVGQETLLNLLLRNYLHYNLYDQVLVGVLGAHRLWLCSVPWPWLLAVFLQPWPFHLPLNFPRVS